MSVNFPALGIGAGFAGLSPLLAPLLAPVADLVAQATPPGMPSSSVWFGLGVLVTALGTAVVQPMLKERGTAEKLTNAMKQVEENTRQIEELKAAIESRDMLIRAKESRVDELIKQLSLATDANVRLADRLFRTSGDLLSAIGKIKPMADTLRPVPANYAGPRPRVLILEDDDAARNSTATTLDLLGFDVVATETLTDARDAMEGRPFDAAIIDLMVPDGDGAAILRSIRDRRLPTLAIVTTGRAEETLGPVYALKPDYLFHKPVEMMDVVNVIRSRTGGAASGPQSPGLAIVPVTLPSGVVQAPAISPPEPPRP